MCLKRIIRRIKRFFVDWLPNRSYKFLAVVMTIIWSIGMIINPILIFVLTIIYTVILALLTWSYHRFKQALDIGKDTTKWTLGTVWQQLKDWREGRRRRKTLIREQEYGN